MAEPFALWLPILLSAVIAFFASSLIHMVLPWHKGDFRVVPDEGRVMEALRPFQIPPGDYMMPRPASMQDMKSPEFIEKRKQGPVLIMTVMPNGAMAMGKNLAQWFIYLVVVGLLVACIATRALPVGSQYLRVFKFVGSTAFLGLAAAVWPNSIWYRRAWRTTLIQTLDAGIYALLMAGTFGWLWPR